LTAVAGHDDVGRPSTLLRAIVTRSGIISRADLISREQLACS
jgi:hypothetical protein